MKFTLTILGVNSAMPAHGRFTTAQVLQYHKHYFLIDCGEGAQIRMGDFHIPRLKIHYIFISHLHGDHVFGLPGFLFSLALNGRKEALTIFSPPGLEEIISLQIKFARAHLPFPLHFQVLDTGKSELIFEDKFLTVNTLPLVHRIPTVGFVFKEKPRPRNIIPEKITEFNISIPQIKAIKNGEDLLLSDGTTIPNEALTHPPSPPRSYAFVTDTIYDEKIILYINGVSLLYHETTFCHDLLEFAEKTMHSTAKQAANIALKAGVGKLITGHYSSRYTDLTEIENEAKAIFPNTELGIEGRIYEIG